MIIQDSNKKTLAPQMKSIKDLEGYRFKIPVYQRGFRWTRQQIKELIEDLYEFCKNNDSEKEIYCLQNITVRKIGEEDENFYEVIDGQQRLTALWILVMSFMDCKKYDGESMPIYTLEYEEKSGLTNYVKAITDNIKNNEELRGSGQCIKQIDPPGDIDSAFINDAFKFIDEIELDNLKHSQVLSTIFCNSFFREDKKIALIWDEIVAKGDNDIEKTKDVINRFSNINANKIPLTESELIKACLIQALNEERVPEFSLQWEELERGLNNEDFWWFISNGSYKETRMDLLFQILLGLDNSYSNSHVLSREINMRLTDRETSYRQWRKVVEIYNTLIDWFENYYFYHLIGLIISIETEDNSLIIRELYEKYSESTKEDFKRYLKERIRKEGCYKIPFSYDTEEADWSIEQADEILFDGVDSDEISYNKNKEFVKPILLLFNISLLINAFEINPDNSAERFSFKLYKTKKNPIEIEHINPQHLEGRKSDNSEYTSAEKEDWANKTIEIIENENEKQQLKEEIDSADWKKNNIHLIERIEAAAKLNSLDNLTLLDKKLNISYGDNFFNEKRSHILAARFGHPVPYSSEEKYYEQSVIFPGTMWVFMRQYMELSHDNTNRWSSVDRMEYIACMQKSIFEMLKPQEKEMIVQGD